jgi:hypothetical protein
MEPEDEVKEPMVVPPPVERLHLGSPRRLSGSGSSASAPVAAVRLGTVDPFDEVGLSDLLLSDDDMYVTDDSVEVTSTDPIALSCSCGSSC